MIIYTSLLLFLLLIVLSFTLAQVQLAITAAIITTAWPWSSSRHRRLTPPPDGEPCAALTPPGGSSAALPPPAPPLTLRTSDDHAWPLVQLRTCFMHACKRCGWIRIVAGPFCNQCKTATATRPLTIWDNIPVRNYRSLRPGSKFQIAIFGTSLFTIGDWVRIRRTCKTGAQAWRSPIRNDVRPFDHYYWSRSEDKARGEPEHLPLSHLQRGLSQAPSGSSRSSLDLDPAALGSDGGAAQRRGQEPQATPSSVVTLVSSCRSQPSAPFTSGSLLVKTHGTLPFGNTC